MLRKGFVKLTVQETTHCVEAFWPLSKRGPQIESAKYAKLKVSLSQGLKEFCADLRLLEGMEHALSDAEGLDPPRKRQRATRDGDPCQILDGGILIAHHLEFDMGIISSLLL
eukprot:SAG31_NODE_4240_length_3427_cov_2.557392_3_plen_112_part_00